MNNTLKILLVKLYSELEIENNVEKKLEIINNIIEIKLNSTLANEYLSTRDIYDNIKLWIELYILSRTKNMKYGYDILDLESISKRIDLISCKKQKQSLCKFTIRLLRLNFSDSHQIEYFEDKYKKLEVELLTDKFCIMSIFKIILLLSSRNLFSLGLTMIICLFLVIVWLIPNGETVIIQYSSYSSNEHVNHAVNILAYLFEMSNDDFKIEIKTVSSLLFVFTIKIFFIVVVLNYVIVELFKKVFEYENI